MTEPYLLTVCQPGITLAFRPDNSVDRNVIADNVAHVGELISRSHARSGARLFVLPQGVFQGCVMRSPEQWLRAAISLPGPESQALGAVARRLGVYICASAFEMISAFPGRYFNSGFIVDPSGDLALVYRKHYAMTSKTRPGDIYDLFVNRFGEDALFPVLDTPLGKLGIAIAGDVNWPEVTRCLAMKGAEVVLNPTSSGPHFDHFQRVGGELARPVRAFENLAYLAMANMGRTVGDSGEPPAGRPPSQVFDFNGAVIATASSGFDQFADALIDIDALRRLREQPTANFLAELQAFLHAPEYARARFWPANGWAERPIGDKDDVAAMEARVWSRFTDSGTRHQQD